MHIRNDYMTGKVSHREYYAQFVSESTKRCIAVFLEKYKECEEARKGCTDPEPLVDWLKREIEIDEHLNNIPIRWVWDSQALTVLGMCRPQMKEAGEIPSKGAGVCIAKEAARQILEEGLKEREGEQ